MASIFSDNISFIGNKPNFVRDNISTVALLLAETPEQKHYPYGHIVFCEEDGKHYMFNYNYNADEQSDDAWNEMTGWFKPISEKVDLSPLEKAVTGNATEIEAEILRAQTAEQELSGSINTLETNFKATLNAEISRARAAEHANADSISAIETTLANSSEMLDTLQNVAEWIEGDATGSATLIADQNTILNYTSPCSFPASDNSEYNRLCYKFIKEIYIYDTSQILNGDVTTVGVNLICRNNDTYGWKIYLSGTSSDGTITAQNFISAVINSNPERTSVLDLTYISSVGGKKCGYIVVDWNVIEDGINMNGLFTWYLNRRSLDLRYSPIIKAWTDNIDTFEQLDELIGVNSDRISEIDNLLGCESTELEVTEFVEKYVHWGGSLSDGAGSYGCEVYDVTGLKGLLTVTAGVSNNQYVCVCRVEDASGKRLDYPLVNTGNDGTNKQVLLLFGNAAKCYVSVPLSSGTVTNVSKAILLENRITDNIADINILKTNLETLEEDNKIIEIEYKNPTEYSDRLEAIAYTGSNPVMNSNQYTSAYRYTLFELGAGSYRLVLKNTISDTVVAGLLDNADSFVDGGNISRTLLSGSATVGTNVVFTLETNGFLVLFGKYGSDTPTEANIYYYASLEKIYYSKVKDKIDEIVIINESLDKISDEVFGESQKADLSAVNVSGYLTSAGEVETANTSWINGRVPIPEGVLSIVFNNLPAADYSSAVSNFFLDAAGAIMTDTRFSGNKILGAGVVEKDIPAGAVELYMTATKSAISSYDIYFKISQGLSDRVAAIEENGVDSKETDTVRVLLPKDIYILQGRTVQLFFRGFIEAVNPYNYDVKVKCAVGKTYPRYYEVASSTAEGSYPITIQVRNSKRTILAEASATIHVISAPDTVAVKNILCVGDSTTQGGQWPSELKRMLNDGASPYTGFGYGMNFVGRKQLTVSNTAVAVEATGGWNWSTFISTGVTAVRFYISAMTGDITSGTLLTINETSYEVTEVNLTEGVGNIRCTGKGSTSAKEPSVTSGILTAASAATLTFDSYEMEKFTPFYNNETGMIDFKTYSDTYCSGEIDILVVLLGVNGLLWENSSVPATQVALAKKFIDGYLADFPNGRIFVSGVIIPDDGTNVYGNSNSDGNVNRYGTLCNIMEYNRLLCELVQSSEYSEKAFWVPSNIFFDTDYCYPKSNKPVNSRSEMTESVGSNGVHPTTAGYYLIADAMLPILVNVLKGE